jgi:hypothetical protein
MVRASLITDAKFRASVVPEIKLCQVPLQMLRADVVIHAINAALHDRKVSFDRVGVCVSANVLTNAVIDELVVFELTANFLGRTTFVGHNYG